MSLGKTMIEAFRRVKKIFKCYFCGKPGHTKKRCRYCLAQNGVPKPPVIQESCKQVDAKDNDKRDKQDMISKLSCGALEMINKADES
jgi:hypothetical protein